MVVGEAQTYYDGDGGGMDNRYNSYDNRKSYETNSYEPTTTPSYGNDNNDNRKSYETNSYEPTTTPSYGMDDNSYQKTYGKDNGYDQSQYKSSSSTSDYKPKYQSYDGKDNYKSSKDSSSKKSVSLNKIKCINTNLNINGNNSGNVSIGNKGAEEGYLGAYSSGDGGYGSEGYKKDKGLHV